MPRRRRITELSTYDRPREKLVRKGVSSLSDFELIEVLIGVGVAGADVGRIAHHIQKLLAKGAQSLSYEALTSIKGVNTAHATRFLAALELAKRHLVRDMLPLSTTQDILARFHDIRSKKQEYFVCLSLDGGNRLLAQRTITIGILDTLLTHPREVYSDAISDRAASIIVAHNHPSGDPHPSTRDLELTQRLAGAGQIIGIQLRDHIIVTKTDSYSFQQHHLL
jgi:DNA repair protein RadC